MEKLREFLVGLMPKEDKLQHYYGGSIAALFFNVFFNALLSALLVTIAAISWEIYRKWKYDYQIDLMDIFYSVLAGFLIYLIF